MIQIAAIAAVVITIPTSWSKGELLGGGEFCSKVITL